MSLNKQQGFTLIELVMVIVILGILAATALPKFVDMTKSARESTLKGLAGAIQGAKSIVKAGYLINKTSPVALADGSSVVVVTTSGAVNEGLPTAAVDGIVAAVDISADFAPSYASGVATFTLDGKSGCTVTYTQATGAVAVSSGGC